MVDLFIVYCFFIVQERRLNVNNYLNYWFSVFYIVNIFFISLKISDLKNGLFEKTKQKSSLKFDFNPLAVVCYTY